MLKLEPGSYTPVGSHFDGQGVNFSLFSAHAEKVELCVFNEKGEETRLCLPCRTGNFWHGYLPKALPGLQYGFRVYGPWQPEQGHRFNPAKLLMDPYAKALSHSVEDSPLLRDGEFTPDTRDSASVAPKSVVVDNHRYDWQEDHFPRVPWCHTVIYEAHVRGLTQQHPQLPAEIRGSYAALSHPVVLDYLKELGITTLELLPVQLHISEPRLQRLGLSNYWGYNVLAPFAIEPSYWSGRAGTTPLSEFQDAVKALHQIGIEVILDVVFNHTAELDHEGDGPTLAQRGLDNQSYYWLDEQGRYLNWSGCGNTLCLNRPATLQAFMDCLRYWVTECHVDGFRFDLAAQLGRTPDFTPDAPLFYALQQDPLLSQCKLIAEPWDMGPYGYQLGHFPFPFREWNDRYRDTVRQFWLQNNTSLGNFVQRLAGSSQEFQQVGRHPSSTINLITAHDGFTLRDLVSFNQKHNEPNGEENRDGHSHNYSHNHGWEGLSAPEDIQALRHKSQRNLLATLLLSQGTPMILAGDELGHSQQGNNNAYCQDNRTTWIDWQQADPALSAFTKELIALRARIPALQKDRWWQDDTDVSWLSAKAQPLSVSEWQQCPAPVLQIRLSETWLIIINPTESQISVCLPAGEWQHQLSTDVFPSTDAVQSDRWLATPKSLTVFNTYSRSSG